MPSAFMNYFSRLFPPAPYRRLNGLVGFLLFVAAPLLFLALGSYSPLDPSLNTAAAVGGTHQTRNWIGMTGALTADLLLQLMGITVFLVPTFIAMIGVRWFRSRSVASPLAKSVGSAVLLLFTPALLGLLPMHWRWLHSVPVEG